MELADNVIKVSTRTNPGSYIYEGKERLKSKGSVAFHAIGGSAVNAVKASERLVSLGYGTLTRFETSLLNEKDREGEMREVYKVIIQLARTPDFDTVYEEYEKTRPKPQD